MLTYRKELLQTWDEHPAYERLLEMLPIDDAMRKIVEEEKDEVVFDPNGEPDTLGFEMKVYLDKSTAPPLIIVHLNDHYACRMFYGDQEFVKRGNQQLARDAGLI